MTRADTRRTDLLDTGWLGSLRDLVDGRGPLVSLRAKARNRPSDLFVEREPGIEPQTQAHSSRSIEIDDAFPPTLDTSRGLQTYIRRLAQIWRCRVGTAHRPRSSVAYDWSNSGGATYS